MLFPFPFIHICKLLQVEPITIIKGLLFSIGSYATISKGYVYQKATDYLLSQKYGQELFTEDQIRQLMTEVGVIMGLLPPPGDVKAFDEWNSLSESYFKSWNTKWQYYKKPPSAISNK